MWRRQFREICRIYWDNLKGNFVYDFEYFRCCGTEKGDHGEIFFADTFSRREQFDFAQYDYIVDAIDTVTGKIALIMNAKAAGTPIISSMGAGNKVDSTAFEVTDIYKTSRKA